MYVLAAQADPPYLPRAQTGAFIALENQQIRFGNTPTFGTTTVNGVLAFWARVSISSAITTVPVIDQIKLHTNRWECNGNGFTEWFGDGRPIGTLGWDSGLFQAVLPSPGNQDIFVSDGLAVGRIENEFNSGANDRVGMNKFLPLDMDTSLPIRVQIAWYRTSNVQIDWTVRWGWSSEGDTIYESTGAAPVVGPNEQSISKSVIAGVVPVNHQVVTSFDLNVPNMIARKNGTGPFGDPTAGDIIWVSINRTDSNGGNATIINIVAYYRRWCSYGSRQQY